MVTTTVFCSGQPILNERVHIDTSNYTAFSDITTFGDSLNIVVADAIDTSIQKLFIRIIAFDENLNEKWRIRIIDSIQGQIYTNKNSTLLKIKDSSFYFFFTRYNQQNINLMEISLTGEILDSISYNVFSNNNAIFHSQPHFLKKDSLFVVTLDNYSMSPTYLAYIAFDFNLNVVFTKHYTEPLFPNTVLGNKGSIESTYKDSLLILGGLRRFNQVVPGAPINGPKIQKGWIKLFNKNGDEIHTWEDTNINSTQPKGIVPLKNGNIITANSYGIYDPESNGVDHGMKVFCLDSTLNQLWEKRIDSEDSLIVDLYGDKITNMILTKDSSLLVSGRFGYYGRLTKIDLDGNVIWDRTYQNVPNTQRDYNTLEHFMDVEQTVDSGFIAVGIITKGTDCQAGIIPCQFGWVLKTDKYGCIVPNCHLYDSIYEPPDTITPNPNPKPEPPDTTEDIVMIMHPNPANDIVNIYFHSKRPLKNGKLRIIDMKGNLVRSVSVFKNDITFRVPVYDLAQGTYIVQYLVDERTFKAEKLVIVR